VDESNTDKTIVDLHPNARKPGEARKASVRAWREGGVIIDFQQELDGVYMVLEGAVAIHCRPNEGVIPPFGARRFDGQHDPKNCPIIGADAYFNRRPSRHRYVAHGGRVKALRCGREYLLDLYQKASMPIFVRQLIRYSDMSEPLVLQMAKHLEIPGAELGSLSPEQFNAICDGLDRLKDLRFTQRYSAKAMELFRELVDMRNAGVDEKDRSIVLTPPFAQT
jgi:hypothetical protein